MGVVVQREKEHLPNREPSERRMRKPVAIERRLVPAPGARVHRRGGAAPRPENLGPPRPGIRRDRPRRRRESAGGRAGLETLPVNLANDGKRPGRARAAAKQHGDDELRKTEGPDEWIRGLGKMTNVVRWRPLLALRLDEDRDGKGLDVTLRFFVETLKFRHDFRPAERLACLEFEGRHDQPLLARFVPFGASTQPSSLNTAHTAMECP